MPLTMSLLMWLRLHSPTSVNLFDHDSAPMIDSLKEIQQARRKAVSTVSKACSEVDLTATVPLHYKRKLLVAFMIREAWLLITRA
jgi:hypothetical protein